MLQEPALDLGGQEGRVEYKFTLEAGQYARVGPNNTRVNLAVVCFGPDGKPLLAVDDCQSAPLKDAGLIRDTSDTYGLRLLLPSPGAPVAATPSHRTISYRRTERHQIRVAGAGEFARAIESYTQYMRKGLLKAIDYLAKTLAQRRAAHHCSALRQIMPFPAT